MASAKTRARSWSAGLTGIDTFDATAAPALDHEIVEIAVNDLLPLP